MDPYEKIYQTLKNDDKNRVTDFSYLNILMPPHPNKQISKSKKNILTDKIYKNNFNEKSISKIDSERILKNKREELKNLPSSINIINKNKNTINGNEKINFVELEINNYIFYNERLNKLFVRENIKTNSYENNKSRNINENKLIFSKNGNK